MGGLSGSASAEISAQIDEVWAVVQDVLAARRTRVSYRLAADPGGVLGMLLRGPVQTATQAIFIDGRPGELKRRVEGGSTAA